MKNLKFIAVFAMMIVGSVTVAAQEVGHINPYALIQAMPEKVSADAELKALYDKHAAEVKKQEDALQKLVTDTQKEMEGKTDEQMKALAPQLQAKQQEFQTKQQALQTYQQAAQKEVAEKEEALMKPINEKAQKAIDKVAAAKGLKYVIDASVVLYANGTDILPDVKKELGIK